VGKKSAEIEYELERQRNALRARTERLDRRVRDDLATVRDEATRDINQTIGKDSKAAQHPKALVGGAAGTGLLLGRLSKTVSLRPRLPSRDGHEEPPPPSRRQRLATAASGTALGTMGTEIDNFVADVWSSFKSGFTGDEPRSPRGYETARELGQRVGQMSAGNAQTGDRGAMSEVRPTPSGREPPAPPGLE
jgi:hypothetical protein